jgi:branched-subunit amino acid ABC-type transport system permease component
VDEYRVANRTLWNAWTRINPLLDAGFSSIAPYLLLLAVLFVRPHGMFGRPRIERV